MFSIWRRRPRAAFIMAALAIAGGALGFAPSAAADEPNYQHATASFQSTQQGSAAGGYISCPAGTKAVASGATAGTDGYLMAGLTTHDGNGGYHTAWGWNHNPLTLHAQCVASGRVAGEQLINRTLRSHRSGYHTYGREIACPTGTLPYGGGAFTSFQGAVTGGLTTIASMPVVTRDGGDGWRYVGVGDLGNGELAMSTHCLPQSKLGRVITVGDVVVPSATYRPVSVAARCPAGYFAFAGGAWISATGSADPAWRGYLTSSAMTADDRGWMAVGYSFQPGTQLYAVAKCTTRLG